VRFSRHAKNRRRFYGISLVDAERTVERPTDAALDRRGNSRLTGLDRNDRAIIVVVASDDPDLVITTFPED
jgi:hypothetical protein